MYNPSVGQKGDVISDLIGSCLSLENLQSKDFVERMLMQAEHRAENMNLSVIHGYILRLSHDTHQHTGDVRDVPHRLN